ncbi:hypothetical protein GCM10009527_097120 [Actinomadura nitritigenes]
MGRRGGRDPDGAHLTFSAAHGLRPPLSRVAYALDEVFGGLDASGNGGRRPAGDVRQLADRRHPAAHRRQRSRGRPPVRPRLRRVTGRRLGRFTGWLQGLGDDWAAIGHDAKANTLTYDFVRV